MTRDLLAAFIIIGAGLSVAGAATHLYQWLARQQAMLRMDGASVLGMFGNLTMSFFCGPYIMLQQGWRHEQDGTISTTSVLFSALVAFGWAFITGLLIMSVYLALRFW